MTGEAFEHENEFSPRRVYFCMVRRWWWVVVCVLAGALAGWSLSALRPPLFESRTVFSFNIDYTLSGVLTDIQEDQALEAVGDLMRSSELKAKVLSEAALAGINLKDGDIRDSVYIERRNNAWLVIVRRPDGAQAEKIAGLWGEHFDAAYQEAYSHALTADGLQRYLNALENCLRETVAIEPVQAGCRLEDLPAVQAELAKTGDVITAEREAAKNLFAGMLYEWSGQADSFTGPVRFGRGRFILFGALAGFLFSLWLIDRKTGALNAGID
jgi:uncharacterized protein involved in exopolysaccharide biosynthesis